MKKYIMEAKVKDIRLEIKIENKQPIELMDLTKSLNALANQFNSYVENTIDNVDSREAKLYVKEIRSGSVILELIELATVGMIPFMENINTLVGFATFLKGAFDYLLKEQGEKPQLSISDCKDIAQIINPVAKDNSSQMNVNVKIDGDYKPEYHFHVSSTEANAVQNILRDERKALKEPQFEGIHYNQIMTWFQARNKDGSCSADKGKIDQLCPNPLKIICCDEIKEEMLKGDENPFNMAFEVDVEIQTANDKPFSYKITKLHCKHLIEN